MKMIKLILLTLLISSCGVTEHIIKQRVVFGGHDYDTVDGYTLKHSKYCRNEVHKKRRVLSNRAKG